jgi:hypothetical protein
MDAFRRFASVATALFLAGCQESQAPVGVPDAAVQAPQFSRSARGGNHARFKFAQLVGVPRPFTGATNAIRGVPGGGLPWVIRSGEARLDDDGTLKVRVEGLVLDPNDAAVISRGLAGSNPVAAFKAILSCQTVGAGVTAAVVNVETATFPATTGPGAGDADIKAVVVPPNPCIAPIVFVATAGGSWLAATGFANGGDDLFKFEKLVGVPRPYTGAANAIRGVAGGGLPWAIGAGEWKLGDGGEAKIEVASLVLDPNDPVVISRGLAGNNPSAAFGATLRCLSVNADGAAVTVNLPTPTAPATTGVGGGDAEIKGMLQLPSPCIAPIVFVTSPTGSWFAASGF